MIDSGQACRRQRRVTRVARGRAAAVVRASIHGRVGASLKLALAATVLFRDLGHVALERRELVCGRLHCVGLRTLRRADSRLFHGRRLHRRVGCHRNLTALVVDVLNLFLLQLDLRLTVR